MLSLKDREWEAFPISDIFTITSGKRLTKKDMKEGLRPFVGAIESNNGITQFLSNKNMSIDSGILGVNYNGSVVETFYHPYECIFSDDVKRFSLKNRPGNRLIYLFLKVAIVQQKVKYAYGYKFNGQRMSKQSILLPLSDTGEHKSKPDWAFMEEYIREREQLLLQKYVAFAEGYSNVNEDIEPLNKKEWSEFKISDYFVIKAGKRLTKNDMKAGKYPFVGATEANNGITNYVYNTNESLDNNVIGVNYNGSVVESFYHPYKCIFSDDVKRFRMKNGKGNKLLYLFLKTIIIQQKLKYAYGYKFNEQRMNKQSILLPVIDSSQLTPEPDWEYMEQYAKAVAYRQLQTYISHVKTRI